MLARGEQSVHFEPSTAEAESGATIYIRVPAALKRDVDEAAREAKTSGNVWAMRCVERCLEGFPDEMTAIWAVAKGLVAPWSSDKPDTELDSYKLTTAVEALEKIGGLVEAFARRRFGTDDLSKIAGAERFLLGPEGVALNQRFQPYPEDWGWQ
jgi:hypothetical protein